MTGRNRRPTINLQSVTSVTEIRKLPRVGFLIMWLPSLDHVFQFPTHLDSLCHYSSYELHYPHRNQRFPHVEHILLECGDVQGFFRVQVQVRGHGYGRAASSGVS